MLLKRAFTAAATTCLVAAATLVVASPSQAADPALLAHDDAIAAANAADQAFVDADWDEVTAQAEAFDAATADLQGHLDAALGQLIEPQSAAAAAAEQFADARDTHEQLDRAAARLEEATAELSGRAQVLAMDEAFKDTAQAHMLSECPALDGDVVVENLEPACASAYSAYMDALWLYTLRLAEYETALGLQAYVQSTFDALGGEVALAAASVALAAAQQAFDDAAAALAPYQSAADYLQGLMDDLAASRQSVADRRADLLDLAQVRSVVVWTLGADNDAVRAGDLVKLTFTVPNSQLFDLTDATVTIESPAGVTPVCDIVGGVVAAGAEVACTAEYTATAANATAGKVVFEVKLRGYIPLGPGNPRAQAVTRTLIETSQTLEVQVAAALAPPVLVPDGEVPGDDTPGTGSQDSGSQDSGSQDSGSQDSGTQDSGTQDSGTPGASETSGPASGGAEGAGDSLSDSGADTSSAGFAVLLVAAGVALLLARRRLEHAKA